MSFIEQYKARLTRINDRENAIFMRALLDQLNNNLTFKKPRI